MLQTQALCRPSSPAAENDNDGVLEGEFRNLNYSTFTKKTTKYWLELFLSIYSFFFFETSTLSNNVFAKY